MTQPRAVEDIVADLEANAAALAEANDRIDALRTDREDLWAEGRAADPPVTMKALADASAVSEPLVIRTMKAHRKANA